MCVMYAKDGMSSFVSTKRGNKRALRPKNFVPDEIPWIEYLIFCPSNLGSNMPSRMSPSQDQPMQDASNPPSEVAGDTVLELGEQRIHIVRAF